MKMTNGEEVFDNIKWTEEFLRAKHELWYADLLSEALIWLKRREEAFKPHLDVDEWKCGNCGHSLEHQEMLGDNMLFHEQYNYCPNCGRAVKWK